MHKTFGFVLDYFLIVKLHALAPFKKVPLRWSVGTKGDIILLQGFGEPWCFLESVGNHFNTLGYRIHTITKLQYNSLSISTSATLLEEFIAIHKLKQVYLIAHSKGGLVAKYFLDTKPSGQTVQRSFSIATPYQGTIYGHSSVLYLKELAPKSKFIQQSLSNTRNLHKIVNIRAAFDNHIIPNENSYLPNAINEEVQIAGHNRVIFAAETINIIQKYL